MSSRQEKIESRRERVRDLHGQGYSLRQVGALLHVSHATIANDLAALGIDSVKVSPGVSGVTVLPSVSSPAALRTEAIERLREQSMRSAVAAKELAKIALDLERADYAEKCEREHIDAAEAEALLLEMWNTLTDHLSTAFVRQVRITHDVDIGALLEASIEEARVILNAAIESRAAQFHDITPEARREGVA